MSKVKTQSIWEGAINVAIGLLVPAHWNANEMDETEFAALIDEIRNGGFDEPCQIVPIDGGKYLILGGHHRFKAAGILGLAEIPCVIKEHLIGADEETLMEWSVKRNNIRGRLNAQKCAEVASRIAGRWKISADAARERMLVKEERLKEIQAAKSRRPVVEDDESLAGEGGDDPDLTVPPGGSRDDDGPGDDRKRPKGERSETDGVADRKQQFAERRALLANLKTFVQEVVAESEETVEHGYLYFGAAGGTHLVVNESKVLYAVIADMVAACKGNSDKVDDFLIAAIKKELPNWQ